MLISIIILTKNEVDNIENCLNTVFSQNCAHNVEVIVIDSGSTDGTVEIINKFPVRLIQIPADEFHHSKTRNLGAKNARGDIIVYLVADALPCNDSWLKSLVSNFRNTNVGAVYGKQIAFPHASPINKFRLSWHYNDKRLIKNKIKEKELGSIKTHSFSDVNSAIRKNVWIGNKYPEDIPFYEDIGICYKIVNNGYDVIYEPSAAVFHSHNHSVIQILQRYFDTAYIYKYLGIMDDTNNQINETGMNYLKSGIKFLSKTNNYFSIPYFILHTLGGYIGLTLGKQSHKLPPYLSRYISEHKIKL